MRLITLLISAVFLFPYQANSLRGDAFLGPHASPRAKARGPETLGPYVIARPARGSPDPALPLPLGTRPNPKSVKDGLGLTREQASHFAGLALKCVRREYPNKMDHVMNDSADVRGPRAFHPAFYGCFDWHSCVHGHWMLARLLRLFPDLKEAPDIRTALNDNLAEDNVKTEAAYFSRPNSQSFERTYGWAWLLKLAEELHQWDDPDARRWYSHLQPLTDAIVTRLSDFLPKQTYPIRTGVHPNTAFALGFALDYARAAGNRKLAEVVTERSNQYYSKDTAYPSAWEPGGEDFLSPALEEADLMRRILDRARFSVWFHRFLPGIASRAGAGLLEPAIDRKSVV